MKYTLAMYDLFENMPLRGLLLMGESMLAFVAQPLEGEPPEITGRRGIYAQVRAFECPDQLARVLQEKDQLFREWRSAFDRGEVANETHPLYTNRNYQALSSQANEFFERLTSVKFEKAGLFRVENGRFVFESISK